MISKTIFLYLFIYRGLNVLFKLLKIVKIKMKPSYLKNYQTIIKNINKELKKIK